MKKIKRKIQRARSPLPAFIIGFVGEGAPPGFLSAWYNQEYGGPLEVRFLKEPSHNIFQTSHLDWKAEIFLSSNPEEIMQWRDRLGWDHSGMIKVFPVANLGSSRMDTVLFLARLARGLTLLTEGTAYDLESGIFWNPSDWSDRMLGFFRLEDHVQVLQEESPENGRQWLITRGMSKFGMEELEIFQPRGLPSRPTQERLLELANVCVSRGKSPKVGECISSPSLEVIAQVVKHRTITMGMGQINVRELSWD